MLVELAATLEVEVKEAMDIVFGLDFRVSLSQHVIHGSIGLMLVQVPDNSYVTVDVIDPTNASQYGL